MLAALRSPPKVFALRLMRKKGEDLRFGYARNLHAFDAAALTAEDSNSRLGRFQKTRQVLAKSDIGAVLDGGRLQTNFQCALDYTGDFIFAGTRLHANHEDNRAFAALQVEHQFARALI